MINKQRIRLVSIVLLTVSTILLSLNHLGINTDQSMNGELIKDKKPFNRISSTSTSGNTIFLPRTNLSVSRYSKGELEVNYAFEGTFNSSILSLNETHWYVKCEYPIPITIDPEESPVFTPFYTYVNRTGYNNAYNASNYYEWLFGYKQETFEFWTDTSNFYDGFSYTVDFDGIDVTFTGTEVLKFYLVGMGNYNTWKVSGIDPYFGKPFSYWYTQEGMFLSSKLSFISDFYFNLSLAELAEIPQSYAGPEVYQLSPGNNSINPGGTEITFQLISPYGVARVYYQWNELENITTYSNSVVTTIPPTDGIYNLSITAVDNIGIIAYYRFVFITNNEIPGISLAQYKNNSQVKGTISLQLAITSGNGSLIYNWDGNQNTTVAEGTAITFANPDDEGFHVLNVFVSSPSGLWTKRRFVFNVDNTPSTVSVLDFVNGSTLKGTVALKLAVSELCNLTYNLNNTETRSFVAESGQNYTLSFTDLDNGSYQLFVTTIDSANNTGAIIIAFEVYVSSFDWNWYLTAHQPRSLNIVDASGEPWFSLTITSRIDQYFNLVLLSNGEIPGPDNQFLSVIKFTCDKPGDIIFMTFVYAMNESMSSNSAITVYKWVYWDSQSGKWLDMTTSFNHLSYTWEATREGSVTYFALVKTGEMLDLGSITEKPQPTAPSFGLLSAFSLLILFLMAKKNKKRTKKEKRY